MLFGKKTLHYRQKQNKITHILIQQSVPECTADDKREFIQTFTAIRTFGKCIREI